MRSRDLVYIRMSYCSMHYRLSWGLSREWVELGLSLYIEIWAWVWILGVLLSLTLIDIDVLLVVLYICGGRLLYLLLTIGLLVLVPIGSTKIIIVTEIEIVLIIILYDRVEIFIHRLDSRLIISIYLIYWLFEGLNNESWWTFRKFFATLDWALLYTVIIRLLAMSSTWSIHVYRGLLSSGINFSLFNKIFIFINLNCLKRLKHIDYFIAGWFGLSLLLRTLL